MQRGLHVGLGAWVHAQGADEGFPAIPANPVVVELPSSGLPDSPDDLQRSGEFARLVSFVPRRGEPARPFESTAPLWEVHRDVLGRMKFATRPWSDADQGEYEAARRVLYDEHEGAAATQSAAFVLYQEFRRAYDELVAAGAPASEISSAEVAWQLEGHKSEIDAALSLVTRLGRRRSLSHAERERHELADDRLLSSMSGSYALTEYAPISAGSTETWLEATATIEDLDLAVGTIGGGEAWSSWRANRSGDVRFRFSTIEVHRPWLSLDLYDADDWRLDEEVVSTGDGSSGTMPAVVDRVHLAQVLDVRVAGTSPPRRSAPSTSRPVRPLSSATVARPVATGSVRPLLAAARPGVTTKAPQPRVASVVGARSLRTTTVTPGRVIAPPSSRGVARQGGAVFALPASRRLAAFGTVQRFGLSNVDLRLAVARSLVARDASTMPGPSTTETPIHVVGFGCRPIPTAPAPNPAYQWS